MIEDERDEQLGSAPPAFGVSPVRRGRSIPILAGVALIVGITAFVAGLTVASPVRSPAPGDLGGRAVDAPGTLAVDAPGTRATAAPRTEAVHPASTFPPAAARSSPTAPPGSSAFIEGFDPGGVIASLPHGDTCTGADALENDVPRTRADGPPLTFQRSWMLFCRIPEAGRQAFLVDLFVAFEGVIPADTYGYRSTSQGAGSALYPYADRPMAGTVAVHADAAGDGLAVVVVVEEWRPDER